MAYMESKGRNHSTLSSRVGRSIKNTVNRLKNIPRSKFTPHGRPGARGEKKKNTMNHYT